MRKSLFSTLALTAALVACSSDDGDGGKSSLTVTLSGEGAGISGFAFPPASGDDLAFVDGWEVRFDRILVTVDTITLSDAPDTNPSDQSQVGRVLATKKGPWAVDLAKPGAANAAAAGGASGQTAAADVEKDPQAQVLVRFDGLDSGSFDPAQRYAFGYEIVGANASAQKMNLDAAADTDYADMVAQGMSVLYVGTATFKGANCTSSDPAYDFTKLPQVVRFRLGFKTPSKYVNCQNTDLKGQPFAGEEAQRGIQVSSAAATTAQITLHTDHPFWNTVDHDAAELFFDQLAAAASADGNLAISDLSSVDFTSFKDRAGGALPWRSCIADKPVKEGTRRFDSGSVPIDPTADPSAALRNYADYVSYQQSTQGHLNADGLCAVTRQFAAPR